MIGCFLRPTRGLLATYETHFIAWPFLDTDVSRLFTQTYAQYMGLARWNFLFSSPFRNAALKRGWVPVTTAETIQYKRAIKAFQRVTVRTRMLCWSEKRFYLEQLFLVGEDIRASCVVEGVVHSPKGALGPVEAFLELGFSGQSPAMPASVESWSRGL
jgi:acyl-CoA thioesterase FadM